MLDAHVAVVGAGAAGLSLARRLAAAASGGQLPVLLLDAPAGPLRPPARTWCYWEEGKGEFDAAVAASWSSLRVHCPSGRAVVGHTSPLRYKMLRSGDFESMVSRELAACGGIRRVEASVTGVTDGDDGAQVQATTADGNPLLVQSRWVFDSRPRSPRPVGRTNLLQHFHGWFVRTDEPAFDPEIVDLMDFRVPQPAHGLAFGYVLPTRRHEALIEYTQFSPSVLPRHAYEKELDHYTRRVLGLGRLEVAGTETGAIPMTDARLHRQPGASVFHIGTAGGATRSSTGYTFTAVQRQTQAIAEALRAGRRPVPAPAHSLRSRTMDAVLLRALAAGRVDGATFFSHLFRQVPTERLLRFMDGRTRLDEDIAIGLHTPVWPMMRTLAELPRLPRRCLAEKTP